MGKNAQTSKYSQAHMRNYKSVLHTVQQKVDSKVLFVHFKYKHYDFKSDCCTRDNSETFIAVSSKLLLRIPKQYLDHCSHQKLVDKFLIAFVFITTALLKLPLPSIFSYALTVYDLFCIIAKCVFK